MKKMTDKQARNYIAGEEFDGNEWDRLHILSLTDSIKKGILEINPVYYENLRKTGERYIENHKEDMLHTKELEALRCAVNSIPHV